VEVAIESESCGVRSKWLTCHVSIKQTPNSQASTATRTAAAATQETNYYPTREKKKKKKNRKDKKEIGERGDK
jgi:hypothetical protein